MAVSRHVAINVGSFCHIGDSMLNWIIAFSEMWARACIPELI